MTAEELLEIIEQKILAKDYKDAVHKITLMTTARVVRQIIEENKSNHST